MAFAITMLPMIGGQRVVIVEGDVDRVAVPELRAALTAATLTPRSRRLTVDVSAAHIRDDSVTACLADAATAAQRAGVDVTVFDSERLPTPRSEATEQVGGLALLATA